ncbi:PHB depolymerase family esterase [Saccharopolyspora erythraea]|uniref:extracellular catalytic domain type 1 short-chain-length polyhydroxyalkanoate depolymerase n=1 Tax=Saccharopolyspora erythraea TaxID=1836 RepID=UPI001BA51B37|nr:PHB depolymerase family esterase [Saccharopolyspora erythraea]QUH02847.1 PHB depolymerase family esterase [Saccharopolyspora erythraea]
MTPHLPSPTALGRHRRLLAALACGLALAAAPPAYAVTPAPAQTAVPRAALTPVPSFGDNPGALNMYAYLPDGLPDGAPLVVLLHGCTQNATDYFTHSGWPEYADQHKFALVLAEQPAANNPRQCFNWFEPADSDRDRGEAASIRQMVAHAHGTYGTDPARTYLSGLSAGAGMAANLLAGYPEVFAGGALHSGPPAKCARTVAQAFGCMSSDQHRTPQQWGELVRSSAPGHSGPWPKVAIWQGTADTTVAPVNATELRDQWTDVHGLSQTPTETTTLPAGTTRRTYADAHGSTLVAEYSIAGMGHGLPVDPGNGEDQCGTTATYYLDTLCSTHHTARFWGLTP